MDALQKVMDLIVEYASEEAAREAEEKSDLGQDYDPNCYGAGFSQGIQTAARQIGEMVTALKAEV